MLLGFKKRFAPMILAREKRHTIRDKRKNAPRVGGESATAIQASGGAVQ